MQSALPPDLRFYKGLAIDDGAFVLNLAMQAAGVQMSRHPHTFLFPVIAESDESNECGQKLR
jgi:hypothetical protein